MNAYELADKLDKSKAWLDSLNTQYKNGFGKYCLLPEEVANMLRQQADKIAELEKQLNLHKNAHHKCVEILQEKQSEPVAWRLECSDGYQYVCDERMLALIDKSVPLEPLYTTPQTNKGGNPEVINTKLQDASTSLESTPPYAYGVVQGKDGRENVSLQFDHPEMCGQKYNAVIPLYTTPQTKDKE